MIEDDDGRWYALTSILWEMLRYDAQVDCPDGVARTASAPDWLKAFLVSMAAVREAALIKVVLLDRGAPINAICRHAIADVVHEAGATIVTRNGDFKHDNGLAVEAYE